MGSWDGPADTADLSIGLSVRGLTKRFGDLTAVSDVTFDIHAGGVTGFLGPKGVGKSTTFGMILGLVEPDSGTALIQGLPYRALPQPAAVVGAALETPGINPRFTGRSHLRVRAAASGISDDRVDEVLELVGLTAAADRRTGSYSLGMSQRLGLGAALLGHPGLLILDEPANGLDPEGIKWLREFLRDFAARDNAVLVSSHQIAEMEVLADDVVVIHRGRLIRHAPVGELLDRDAALLVETSAPDRLSHWLMEEGMEIERTGLQSLVVRGGSARRIGELALAAGVPLHGLASEQTRLEAVFLELTREENL